MVWRGGGLYLEVLEEVDEVVVVEQEEMRWKVQKEKGGEEKVDDK